MNNELKHYGILGMKWGIRRYQPYSTVPRQSGKGGKEIGEARRLDKVSTRKAYKILKKDVRNARAERHGIANRYMIDREIGENSEKLRKEKDEEYKIYMNSKEYKNWEKKYNEAVSEYMSVINRGGDYIDASNAFTDKEKKLLAEKPAAPKGSLDFAYTYSINGKKYLNDFLTGGGKELTIARLKDLGYDEQYAKQLTQRLIKKGYSLGDI